MGYSIAFGPDNSWVKTDDDDDICWSNGLPERLYNLLNGRYCNTGQNNSTVKLLAFTEEDYFVKYDNGKTKWSGNSTMREDLDEANTSSIEFFSFGDSNADSYIFGGDGKVHYNDVPQRMEELIQTRKQYNIKWAAIGHGNAWFLKFSDGKMYWDGDISEHLDATLTGDKYTSELILSPFSQCYYVSFTGRSPELFAINSLSNSINTSRSMNPHQILYSHDSISSTFSCGRSIYNVADELERGVIEEDDIPAMRVVEVDGTWYSLDNRRLWVFKKAVTKEVPVIVEEPDNNLRNRLRYIDGSQIRVRG